MKSLVVLYWMIGIKIMNKDNDISLFFVFIGAILAVIIYGSEYQSSCINFINNYWIYSIVTMCILFILLFIVFFILENKYKNMNNSLIFVLFFLYIIPVSSFYTIPKIIDIFNPAIIKKEKTEFNAIVKRIYYVRRANDPLIILEPINNDSLDKEITLTITKKQASILKEKSLIRVYGTHSLICFKYSHHSLKVSK